MPANSNRTHISSTGTNAGEFDAIDLGFAESRNYSSFGTAVRFAESAGSVEFLDLLAVEYPSAINSGAAQSFGEGSDASVGAPQDQGGGTDADPVSRVLHRRAVDLVQQTVLEGEQFVGDGFARAVAAGDGVVQPRRRCPRLAIVQMQGGATPPRLVRRVGGSTTGRRRGTPRTCRPTATNRQGEREWRTPR